MPFRNDKELPLTILKTKYIIQCQNHGIGEKAVQWSVVFLRLSCLNVIGMPCARRKHVSMIGRYRTLCILEYFVTNKPYTSLIEMVIGRSLRWFNVPDVEFPSHIRKVITLMMNKRKMITLLLILQQFWMLLGLYYFHNSTLWSTINEKLSDTFTRFSG